MNAYEEAIKENGFAVVDGVKYAIYERPQMDQYQKNYKTHVGYMAIGFTEADIEDDGSFDPLFNGHVMLLWDAHDWFNDPESGDEFDCDWESDAEVI